jgi:hypothetical protein
MGALPRVETVKITINEMRIEDRRHLADTQRLNLRRIVWNLCDGPGDP